MHKEMEKLITHLLQLYFEKSVRMRFTLPKWGLGSLGGFPKVQSSIARVKTPCIGAFFISLEIYWNVDVQNGLAWPIWTSATQVMAKRKVGNLRTKSHLDATPVEWCKVYYMGEGGGFPRVRAVVSLMSPELLVTCSSTQGAPKSDLTNLLVGLMQVRVNN